MRGAIVHYGLFNRLVPPCPPLSEIISHPPRRHSVAGPGSVAL